MIQLSLPSVLDLAAASALADTLRAASPPFLIDGSGVDRIGVAGLQVLLSAQATAAAAGAGFSIDEPSAALVAAARTAGAGSILASDR